MRLIGTVWERGHPDERLRLGGGSTDGFTRSVSGFESWFGCSSCFAWWWQGEAKHFGLASSPAGQVAGEVPYLGAAGIPSPGQTSPGVPRLEELGGPAETLGAGREQSPRGLKQPKTERSEWTRCLAVASLAVTGIKQSTRGRGEMPGCLVGIMQAAGAPAWCARGCRQRWGDPAREQGWAGCTELPAGQEARRWPPTCPWMWLGPAAGFHSRRDPRCPGAAPHPAERGAEAGAASRLLPQQRARSRPRLSHGPVSKRQRSLCHSNVGALSSH